MSDLDVTIERPICTAAICDNTGRQVAPVEIESAVDLELIELKDQLCRQRVDFTRAAELLDKA